MMGVNFYILDRRTAVLFIGGREQTVGTLRSFFKHTELDAARAAELEAAARISPSPAATMIMEVFEMPLATHPKKPVPAHLVLGWDEGRGSVTDFVWNYLPTLGFAVRDRARGAYTLYEARAGLLYEIDAPRAHELRLIDQVGNLIRHGQPRISECRSVKPYISGFAEADCTLEDGRKEVIMIEIMENALPERAWLAGKKPIEVEKYSSKS